MTCEDRRDLMLLYILGTLDPNECHELEQHLYQGCPQCAGALAEARVTVMHLPLALDPVEPPAETKARLFQRIEQSNGERARGESGEGTTHRLVEATPVTSDERPASADVHAADQHPSGGSGGRSRPQLMMQSLAAMFVIGSLTTIVVLVFELQADSRRIAQLETQMQEVEAQMQEGEALTAGLDGREAALADSLAWTKELMSLLVSPATEIVSLQGVEENKEDLWARLLWDQNRNVCHIVSDVLRPPEEDGRQYRIWLLDEYEQSIFTRRIDVKEGGTGSFAVELMNDNDRNRIASAVVSYDRGSDTEKPEEPILRGLVHLNNM